MEATSKSPAHRDKILAWLRMRGPAGVLNTELNSLCMRFGARIYELRKAGYDIKTEKLDESRFRFVLSEDGCERCGSKIHTIVEHEDNTVHPAHEYRNQASLFA